MLTIARIKDIAEVSNGYTFRGAVQPSLSGQISVLQAKDVNQSEYFENDQTLIKTSLMIPRSNSYLKYNDILLVSRGSNSGSFKSTVFKSSSNNVVASSSINIIRVKDKSALPEYLSIFINSADGQNLLSQITIGSNIRTLLRKNLEALKVPILPKKKQRIIIALYQNAWQQERIIQRIIKLKENITKATFKSILIS